LNVTIELSDSERERYGDRIQGDRGIDSQLLLKRARALVIGVGAEGSAAAAELVSRGVGFVAVVDGGTVALRDLVGQALYYTPDVGESKADTTVLKLGVLNPEVQLDSYPVALDERNAVAITAGHDVVLECSHDPVVAGALDSTGTAVLRSGGDHPNATAAGACLAADALALLIRAAAEALQ
jgi:molybdopterin/thiamine biosynthesis adenylyltransferase